MARKKARSSNSKKKGNFFVVVFVVMVLAAIGIGVGSSYFSEGKKGEKPSARTADGRLVIMEFFDYG
jgi:flagellar basal body-associated protein FliL